MRISVDDIDAFIKVADAQSFNRAADALGITQSALSRRLMKLEDQLGAKLFDRTTRSVNLTNVGKAFLPKASRIIRDYDRSLSDMQDIIQIRAGVVTMASNFTIADTVLPEVIKSFIAKHPAVHLRILEDSDPAGIARIASGDVEFGILQIDEDHPDLEYEALLNDAFQLVCHPEHPLASKSVVRWKDLADHPFISMTANSGTAHSLALGLRDTDVTLNTQIEVAHLSALMELVARGLGVSAIPGLAARKRPDLDLLIKPLRDPIVTRDLGIVQRRGRTLSPAASELADDIRDAIKTAEQ